MAFRNFRFLSLVLAILALALVGAGCGGDDGGGSSGGGGDGGSDDAGALLKKAFSSDVKSADLKLSAKGEVKGTDSDAGEFAVTLSGPYESQGATKLPLLDWDVKVTGMGTTFDGGIVVVKDNAFVTFRGQTYEVGKQLFTQYSQQLETQSQDTPKSLTDLGVDPATWLDDPKVEDGDEIGGDSTQLVTGSVNVRKVIDDIFELLKNPAIKQQLEAQGTSPDSIEKPSEMEINEVEDAIKSLDLEVNVDENDVLRRFLISGDFANVDKPRETASGSLDVTLESVGEGADIQAPSGARPITELLQQFGALGAGGGGLGGSTGP